MAIPLICIKSGIAKAEAYRAGSHKLNRHSALNPGKATTRSRRVWGCVKAVAAHYPSALRVRPRYEAEALAADYAANPTAEELALQHESVTLAGSAIIRACLAEDAPQGAVSSRRQIACQNATDLPRSAGHGAGFA